MPCDRFVYVVFTIVDVPIYYIPIIPIYIPIIRAIQLIFYRYNVVDRCIVFDVCVLVLVSF